MDRYLRQTLSSASSASSSAQTLTEPSKRSYQRSLSLSLLSSSLSCLSDCRSQRSAPQNAGKTSLLLLNPELLVLAAETCLDCGDYASGRELADEYLKQQQQQGTSPDQFAARALFVMARTTVDKERDTDVPQPGQIGIADPMDDGSRTAKAAATKNKTTAEDKEGTAATATAATGDRDLPSSSSAVAAHATPSRRRQMVNGAESIRRIKLSVSYLLESLDFTTASGLASSGRLAPPLPISSYSFLVYNASVHYWNIVRPLMRDGTRKYLAPSLTRFVDALAEGGTGGDPDRRWRMQLAEALVLSLDEALEYPQACARVAVLANQAKELMAFDKNAFDKETATAADERNDVQRKRNELAAIIATQQQQAGAQSAEGAALAALSSPPPPQISTADLEQAILEGERDLTRRDGKVREASLARGSSSAASERVGLLRLHVCRNASTSPECKKLLEEAEKDGSLFPSPDVGVALATLQKAKSGIIPEGKEEKDKRNNLEAMLNAVVNAVCPGGLAAVAPGTTHKDVDVSVDSFPHIVDAGSLACRNGMDDLAARCVSLAQMCKGGSSGGGSSGGAPAARVRLDYLRCEILAKELDGKNSVTEDVPGASGAEAASKSAGGNKAAAAVGVHSSSSSSSSSAAATTGNNKDAVPPAKLDARHVDALRLSRRVEALKLLDRTLLTARRLGDPNLLQEGAVLAWNLGLPLLQPHLRKHVHRVFSLAAQILADISSPLTKLRSMLHLEVAKCELSSDFLAKAASHVAESITQDYGLIDEARVNAPELTMDEPPFFPTPPTPTPEEQAKADARNDKLRPFDRYSFPMHRKLELRTSIYKEPDNAEEKALLQLEQAKEVSDVGLQRTLLQKSAALLELSLSMALEKGAAVPPSSGGGGGGESVAGGSVATAASGKAADKGKAAGDKKGSAAVIEETFDPAPDPSTVNLDQVCDPANGIATGGLAPMEAPSQTLKRQTSLWFEIVTMAWSLRHVELVQRAALPVLANIWSHKNNREFVVMQVKAQFTLAESFVESLKLMQVPAIPAPPAASASEAGDELAHSNSKRTDPRALGVPCERGTMLSPPDSWADRADKFKAKVVGAINAGLQRATRLGPSAAYLVESGAVLLWNYHIHIFRAKAYKNVMPQLVDALKVAHKALTTTKSKDVGLKAALTEALALLAECSGDLTAAENWCAETIPLGRPMQVKRLVEILARVKYAKGMKEFGPNFDAKAGQKANPLFEVSALCVVINKCAEKGESESKAERTQYLNSALSTLKTFRDARLAETTSREAALAEGKPIPPSTTTLEDDEERLEFEVELWVRLAMESLNQKLSRQAQFCCSAAIEQLPGGAELRKRIPAKVWRWFSCAETLWGRAIAAMVNSEGQDRTLQDELRRASLKHIVTAARFGNRARQPALVLTAAQYLWNISLPLAGSAISRNIVFPFVKVVLAELSTAGVTKMPEFRADLYTLLLDCFTDVEDWNGGLESVNEAFLHIPPELQRPLWQRRVVFMSKLGKGVLDGMQKMKESDPVLQARVWAILARAASSTKQQMSAYVQAMDSLNGRFERFEYCVEMAEWMIQSGLSKKDSNDILMSAVDGFLAIEEKNLPLSGSLSDDDRSDGEDDAEDVFDSNDGADSVRSGHSRVPTAGGMGSRTGSRSAVVSPAGGLTSAGGATKSAGGGKPSSANTSMRQSASRQSIHSNRSAASSVTGGDDKKNDMVLPAALDVSHMDVLIKCVSIMAKGSDGFRVRIDSALAAAHYAERVLLLSIDSANDGSTLAVYEKMGDEEKVKVGGLAEYIKSVPLVYSCPARMQDWAEYSFSPQMLQHMKNVPPFRAMQVVSTKTVTKPPLTVAHLFNVADILIEEGLTLQALPLLMMAELVSHLSTSTRNELLIALCSARVASALSNLGKPQQAVARLAAAGPYGLNEEVAKKYKEEVEQLELLKAANASGASVVTIADEKKRKKGAIESARKVVVKRFEARHMWAQLAAEMVKLEQPNTATQYLDEALRHCNAFDDLACKASVLITKAKVAAMNGETQVCIESCKLAILAVESLGGAEPMMWAEASLLMASANGGPPLYMRGEAKRILKGAHDAFVGRMKCVPEMLRLAEASGNGKDASTQNSKEVDLEAASAYALVTTAYANSLATEAMESRANKGPWYGTWKESQAVLVKCCETLAELSDGSEGNVRGASRDVRPPQLLVDVLEFRSKWELRMSASDDPLDNLKTSITLLNQATKIALENHAFSCPPESSSDVAQVAQAEPLAAQGLAAKATAVLTLPTARRAAGLQIDLCRLFLVMARSKSEHVSSKDADEEYARRVTDPVTKYLDATAPVVLRPDDLKVQNLQSALLCATSARRLAKHCPALIAAANAAAGECLSMLSSQRGLLDKAWDVALTASASLTALGEGHLTPSASVADLQAAAAGGKGGKGAAPKAAEKKPDPKKGGKDAKDAEDDAASKASAKSPDDEIVIDETGDIRSQARCLLTAAGNALNAMGSYQAALSAHINACEAAGSALNEGAPVDALRSLLKGQAAGCSEWLEYLRITSTETEPIMRDRVFARRVGRCARDRGNQSVFEEDLVFRPCAGGNHGAGSLEFPPVVAAKTYLDSYSTPWKRLTNVGGSGESVVDDLLLSMPSDVKLFVLQMNADCSTLYCGVASKENMPAIAKMVLTADDRSELNDIVAKLKGMEGSSFNKSMISYADESGDAGDFTEDPAEAQKQKEGIIMIDEGENELVSLILRMERFLSPVLQKPQIAKALEALAASKSRLVILPDTRLQLFPLEALAALSSIASVSRDFSAQIFLMRLTALSNSSAPSCKNTTYIADPRFEDKGSAVASKPRPTVVDTIEDICGKAGFGGAWKGVTGKARIPSDGEWQNLLGGGETNDTSVARNFLYYGPGRCLARFEPKHMCALNIDNCHLVVLADRAENDSSYRKQSKLDNQKKSAHLALENSMETAALFTLSGANCIVLNRWASSFHANARIVKSVFGGIVDKKLTVTEAVAAYRATTTGGGSAGAAATGKRPGSGAGTKPKDAKGAKGVPAPAAVEAAPQEESEAKAVLKQLKARVKFNTIVVGLPHLTVAP